MSFEEGPKATEASPLKGGRYIIVGFNLEEAGRGARAEDAPGGQVVHGGAGHWHNWDAPVIPKHLCGIFRSQTERECV